jgi:hypothetical protein
VDIVWLVVPGAVAGVAAVAVGLVAAVRRWWLLTASLLGAASALLLVTGWLLADPGVSRADALKTGGLAGGAVLGQYALWINDRRRRTEEARQEVEQDRARQDRDRVSDERFARAVELLGHGADQVRVGALHALAGLARSRPSYTQTVLDVLCSYLRRPFEHPSYELRPDNPDQAEVKPSGVWPVEEVIAADRERQVRLTAQRLVADLLPGEADAEPARYDLDLTAATVEYLDLTGRRIGRLIARRAPAARSKPAGRPPSLPASAVHRRRLPRPHRPVRRPFRRRAVAGKCPHPGLVAGAGRHRPRLRRSARTRTARAGRRLDHSRRGRRQA